MRGVGGWERVQQDLLWKTKVSLSPFMCRVDLKEKKGQFAKRPRNFLEFRGAEEAN